MIKALQTVIRDLATPGVGNPYQRGVIAIGHAMVGAAFVSWTGWMGVSGAIGLALVYWLVKELPDIRRGGLWTDGLEDALMVAMGGLYGWAYWPEAILATGFGIMVLAEWRR